MKVASIIKDGYFRSENEARLVYMRFKKRGDDVFYPDIQIRHRESTSIPYIRLFEGSFLGDRSPLESIIIGPHPDRDRRREALMIYLEGRGLGHIEVLQSEVPYLGG